jgi:hypothetical protein
MVKTTSRPPGLSRLPDQVLCPAAPSMQHVPVRPGLARAAADMDIHRATAVRILREHARAGGSCARCGGSWPCVPAHLAASALGAG